MIFLEKYFSYYIPLTDQIYLSDYIYFLKYWPVCVMQFVRQPGCDVMNVETNLSLLTSRFPT